MRPEYRACVSELEKIALHGNSDRNKPPKNLPPITKARLLAALKWGGAAAASYGIGYGLGSTVGERYKVPILQKLVPTQSPEDTARAAALAGGAVTVGNLAMKYVKDKFDSEIEKADRAAEAKKARARMLGVPPT